MHKLRGTGGSFSTSDKPWRNFPGSTPHGRKVIRQNAKRWRIVKAGLAGLSKDELRDLAEDAAKTHRVTHVPQGKRRYPARDRIP
jgi:hypothetical protein